MQDLWDNYNKYCVKVKLFFRFTMFRQLFHIIYVYNYVNVMH